MKGIVDYINEQRGMVAVLTDDGDYSIIEILGSGGFDLGDEVSWAEHMPLGGGTVMNLTRGGSCSVFFQDHWVSKDRLSKALFLE